MISTDVFSQGERSVLHGVSWPKFDSQRILAGAPAEFVILGGAVAAPILSLTGWVGLILPPGAGLHQAAAGLLAGGMIGLGIALIGAHSCKARAGKAPVRG